MKINYTPEQFKRAQRNGARKRNGTPMRCPECGGRSFTQRKKQPQFLSCNNCKTMCMVTEAIRHAQHKPEPAPVVREPKGPTPQRYEYEWRPLKRNVHEHAQLAMLARRT